MFTETLINFLPMFTFLVFLLVVLTIILPKLLRRYYLSVLITKIRRSEYYVMRMHTYCVLLIRIFPLRWYGLSFLSILDSNLSNNSQELFKSSLINLITTLKRYSCKAHMMIHKGGSSKIYKYVILVTKGITRRSVLRDIMDISNAIIYELNSVGVLFRKITNEELKYLTEIITKPLTVLSLKKARTINIKESILNSTTNPFISVYEFLEKKMLDFTSEITLCISIEYSEKRNAMEERIISENKTSENTFYHLYLNPTLYVVRIKPRENFFPKDLSHELSSLTHLPSILELLITAILSLSTESKKKKYDIVVYKGSMIENLTGLGARGYLKLILLNQNLLFLYVSSIIKLLDLFTRQLKKEPDLDVREDLSHGELLIGFQMLRDKEIMPFKLTVDDLKRHILILGPSGAGKTRLARVIIDEILRNPKLRTKIWIFDFHGEHIDLIQHNFRIITPGSLEFPLALNIFEPHLERPESYVHFLTNLITELFQSTDHPFTPQMERILSMALNETVMRSDQRAPHFFIYNLWYWSKKISADIPTAIQSFHGIINRIRSIFSGISGSVYWVMNSNINISRLLDSNVIFNMSNLTKRGALKRDLMLLVNVLLRYVISELINRQLNLIHDEIKLLIILEEGRYLVPWRKRESSLDTSMIEDFAVLARKYGLSLCTISQSPKTISPDIIENAGTIFILGGTPPDTLLLDETTIKYLNIMPPREALVRLTSRPSICRVKIRSINIPKLSERDYQAYLRKSLSLHATRYNPIPVSFEEFLAKIMSDEITLNDLYEFSQQKTLLRNHDESTLITLLRNIIREKLVIMENNNPSLLIHNPKKILKEILTEIPVPRNHLTKICRGILLDLLLEEITSRYEIKHEEKLDLRYNLLKTMNTILNELGISV